MTKKEIRKKYLEKRKELGQAKIDLDKKILLKFFSSFSFIGNQTIHIYLPMEKFNEVNTNLIIEELKRRGQRIVVPKIIGEEIISIEINDKTSYRETTWEIMEPLDGPEVKPEAVDVVIVPLLAFDTNGNRVGYGKGFYDRFLKKCRSDSLKIGLSFFPGEETIEDLSEADFQLTHCVTPDRIYEF
jgi:5-formyltetrahydrofolate cyclo-ligase